MIYEYMNGALSKVKTYAENDNGTAYEEYNHTYDVFGNQLSVSVGNMSLSTNIGLQIKAQAWNSAVR